MLFFLINIESKSVNLTLFYCSYHFFLVFKTNRNLILHQFTKKIKNLKEEPLY